MKSVQSVVLQWIEWVLVTIEGVLNSSLPTIEIVWLVWTAVHESKQRVRAALKSYGISLPAKKIIVNMSPSNIRKSGTRFDLALFCLLVLLIQNIDLPEYLKWSCILGEVWLDGTVKHVDWILPSIRTASIQWVTTFILPLSSIHEIPQIQWCRFYCIATCGELIDACVGKRKLKQYYPKGFQATTNVIHTPFRWIIGHEFVKRALQVAMQWRHNVLLVWPPWVWKSLLAKSLKEYQHSRSYSEMIETQSIHSLRWWELPSNRPCRAVHHTISYAWLIWGWRSCLPWEISLAHNWILLMDELPEFSSSLLDTLRQPLQDKTVTLWRIYWSITYPCNIQLVATMNPCPCWWYWDENAKCTCSYSTIQRYQKKISWPLLDRFDCIIPVHSQNLKDCKASSRTYHLNNDNIDISYCKNFTETLHWLVDAGLVTHRWMDATGRVATSVAMIEGCNQVETRHIYEAVQYRTFDYFLK